VLLLPNFQRSFGITASRFFDRGAKVSGLFISAKFFLNYEEKILRRSAFFLKNFPPFFEAGCKDNQVSFISQFFLASNNFFFKVIFHSPGLLRTDFQFFRLGCKGKGFQFLRKIFVEKNYKNFSPPNPPIYPLARADDKDNHIPFINHHPPNPVPAFLIKPSHLLQFFL